ncbi:hypothetical protein L1987_33234 [Smallanthus sonchifolius]|uniref:Uncharacterized protein n=1 Tax=Smallanthus sonchifolius TaxID=185202 RepID=A0ACB9HQ83_9ASTR|nr:hypothetical protein L1987_33234 [Smallanthus sonchifolius]
MDELIGNLKVHEVIMENDDEISKVENEKNKFLGLKAKHSKSSSEEDDGQSNSDDGEEYAMVVTEFNNFFRRTGKFVRQPRNIRSSFNNNRRSTQNEKKDKYRDERICYRYGDPNHSIHDCPNPPKKDNKKQAFVGGA